jgi:hypothetical protein
MGVAGGMTCWFWSDKLRVRFEHSTRTHAALLSLACCVICILTLPTLLLALSTVSWLQPRVIQSPFMRAIDALRWPGAS